MSMSNQFDLNNFNSFLAAASKTIACDSECQRNQKAEQLKTQYQNAQANLSLAEPQYQIAKRNYYTYVSGQNGYNDMIEAEYQDEADNLANKIKAILDEEISKAKVQLDTYNGISINFENVAELEKQYSEGNKDLFKQIKNNTSDVLTNERKTYYESQGIDKLNNYYYYFLLVIYIVSVICYVIFSLFYPSNFSIFRRVLIFVLLVILPFISTWLLGKFIQVLHWLYNLLPKNVYK